MIPIKDNIQDFSCLIRSGSVLEHQKISAMPFFTTEV